jgi:hypothetical protein
MRSTRIFVILTAALLCVATAALAHQGPGKSTANLFYGNQTEVAAGHVDVWNNGKQLNIEGDDIGSKLMVEVTMDTDNGWYMTELHIQAGFDSIPVTKKGAAIPGQFNCTMEFSELVPAHTCVFDLDEDFDFSWGNRNSRVINVSVHAAAVNLDGQQEGAWARPETSWFEFARSWGWWYTYELAHPMRGHFIDSPVKGHGYITPTHAGTAGSDTDQAGGFWFFPGEWVDLFIGPPTYDSTYSFYLGTADAAKKISPLDMFESADTDDLRVIGVARVLQTLDSHESNGNITIETGVAACFTGRANDLNFDFTMFGDEAAVEALLADVVTHCQTATSESLVVVSAADAKGNLEAGLNASGVFRKNVSKTEDWAEDKQKLEVMPVYFPGTRSNGDPSLCVDVNEDGIYNEGEDTLGVPYEEWRLGGDPDAEECDPRLFEDETSCVITLIECRLVAKPLLVTYLEKIDIQDDQVTTDFRDDRFSWDTFTAVSRDDGTTWKRMNVSRMADLSSFDLETEEPFPGTTGSPYLKIDDNYILNVWESKFCKSGNPRYSINLCDDPATEEVEEDDPLTAENECAIYCRGNAEQGTEVCEPDYPYDDDYFVTDIWGVRGQQQSVNYDEVDDVAELGIGEIPYSCLWAARGVIVTQKEIDEGTFASLSIEDDPTTDPSLCTGDSTPFDCCTGVGTGECDESDAIGLGDIVWYKPERITSGRRDAYIPVVNSARGAGFAIAWQEDPKGLRPGKGKGPGEGWSGAISNHKTDIWYTYITRDDYSIVDENFVPGGPPDDGGPDERPGFGRPKAMVPFSLPVRISDNDTVNTHTLKVVESSTCVTPTAPDGTTVGDEVCFPEAVQDTESLEYTFVPIAEEEIAKEFCDHELADPDTCCDPDNHEGDPNCEDLKGLYGNLSGTKRYAYLAKSIDEIDNATGLHVSGGDGVPDYQYYVDRGGTLDLCRTAAPDPTSYMEALPGTTLHERWYGFVNSASRSKLVCVTSDGRLLDGDVFASRPMLQLQPYTKADGSKSAWALLAYEESKGMGHSLAAAEHEDGDEILGGVQPDDPGQDKPIKQDIGKNMIYHSFDFTKPDLVDPGHIVNLPALCGGLYPAPNYCGEEYTGTNPTCDCVPGQPVPLYFDDYIDYGDGTGEWMPDTTKFLQYRTEIARRARFLTQSPSRMGASKTLGALIYKQGQEGQGRPADAFIRRFVKRSGDTGNPYKFENMVCTTYLDDTFDLPGCPTDGVPGYNCNVWGEAAGDKLCGGVFDDPNDSYPRRDHINLTSAFVDLAVGTGPDDDTPEDPTDDVYNRNKVLLWHQEISNLGDESFGSIDGISCDPLNGEVCPGMYSNVRSHRGFIRSDFFGIAYALSPNWAAARNGNDRYNFYVRRSFDGGQTWTTDPGGEGIDVCPEFRTDPDSEDPDGTGNLPPAEYDATCGTFDSDAVPEGELPPMPVGSAMTYYLDPLVTTSDGVQAQHIGAGAFEPARNLSEIKSNKETSADPRIGTTPLVYPLDGRLATLPNLCPQGNCVFVEDTYIDNMFFVAWGTADNAKSTGGDSLKTEATPLDTYYTRSVDWGDTYLKIPWVIGGENSNAGYGETVWRYDYLAKGEPEEQGECQLKATSDGSKVYAIFHSMIPEEEDPDAIPTRWYPWKPEVTYEDDVWFRRVIFWPDTLATPAP